MRPLLILSSLIAFQVSANSETYWETVFHATEEARLRASKIHQPIDDAQTTSKFGLRFHPILSIDKLHRGIDFSADLGIPFKAAGRGVVLYAEERGDLGLTIAIEHSNGYVTRYGHASKLLVSKGDYVEDQMIIGLVGKTGIATASHLHFETIKDGVHVDPAQITTLYDPNDNLSTLEERVNSLLSPEQIATLEQSGYHISSKPKPETVEDTPIVLDPVDELADVIVPQATESTNLTEQSDEALEQAISSIEVTDNVEGLEITPDAKRHPEIQVGELTTNPSTETTKFSKDQSTWSIAEGMIKGTDLTIFQALVAIYELNTDSFKDSNIHLRVVDAPDLKLPSLEEIALQDEQSAKDKCYDDLNKLKLLTSSAKVTTSEASI